MEKPNQHPIPNELELTCACGKTGKELEEHMHGSWEEDFKKTKFAKGGGTCFECCDYEEMYGDLLLFIAQTREQAKEEGAREERERSVKVIEEVIKELEELRKKVHNL